MSDALVPGTHVIVYEGALISLCGSESSEWTRKHQNGFVIGRTPRWNENQGYYSYNAMLIGAELSPTYIVLLSADGRLYSIEGNSMVSADCFDNVRSFASSYRLQSE